MATMLTCYGGVEEIGGNKILLESAGLRVLFDFGKAFGRYGAYFDGVFVKERVTRGLLDPVRSAWCLRSAGCCARTTSPCSTPAC